MLIISGERVCTSKSSIRMSKGDKEVVNTNILVVVQYASAE